MPFPDDYFHESIHGTLYRLPDGAGLALALDATAPPADANILQQGKIILRYAIESLRSPHAIIIGMMETENGVQITNEGAWEFMWRKFQLYARADIIGLQHDGKPTELYVRDLDFGEGATILAYETPQAEKALGRIEQIIGGDDDTLPPWLARYR